jgi:hypothetical protein
MEQASGVQQLNLKRMMLYIFFLLANPINAAVRSGGRDGSLEHLQVQLDQMVGAPRGADNQQVTCQLNSKDLLSVAGRFLNYSVKYQTVSCTYFTYKQILLQELYKEFAIPVIQKLNSVII